MSITIKTADEITKMRAAGHAAALVLEMIAEHVRPGITTNELDHICHDFMLRELKVIPAPLHYRGYPKSICTSVNHQVCHGIPSDKRLKDGDALNIDITVIKDGFHGDTSKMFMIGKPNVLAMRLADISHQALWLGIEQARPGACLGDIGHAIQRFAEANRCSVVREYCGHGIGRDFHEDPQVLHYGKPGEGVVLRPGMCFTIEPMINAGRREVKVLPDKWTVVTRDRKPSAQWEHTLLITEDGHEVLTLRAEERPASP